MTRYWNSKARLRHAMVNGLICYVTFMLTCMVTWMHMHPKIEPPPEDLSRPTRLRIEEPTRKLLDSKPETRGVRQEPPPPIQYSTRNSTKSAAVAVQGIAPTQAKNCTKTIESLTKYSKWFRGKFKPSTKIFLDKDDINNYKKWSSRILPLGFKGQNLEAVSNVLLHENFTNPPVHGALGKQGCIRCAVVGSGGILNGSGAGEEIDSHDYVFRLNEAHSSERFVRDIGRRITFYTFYPESQNVSRAEDKSVLAFYAMFKPFDVDYALKILNGEDYTFTKSKVNKNGSKSYEIDARKFKIIHPGFFYHVYHDFLSNKGRPTTGALVTFIAIYVCDEVSVYGFGYDPRFTLHYYDKEFINFKKKMKYPHNVENERKLWLKLHDEGVIRLFKRDL